MRAYAWKMKPDGFLTGMLFAVALAFIIPEPGAEGGALHPEILTKLGVALIFFLHGAAISFAAMKAGFLNWRVHTLVQASTFIVFPLLGWFLFIYTGHMAPPDLRIGYFFLCALPSTVSSSVAMTALARGNVAAAVFNATLSSMLGIFITPLWMGVILREANIHIPYESVILDLCIWLLLPLVAGQLMRPILREWISRHKRVVHIADRSTILLLVYTSFCDSVQWGVWDGRLANILITVFLALVLFIIIFAITLILSRLLGLNNADKAAAVFCGSKKSLATGVPMARLIFGASPALGMVLLPILIYHPLQLFLCGIIAARWGKRAHGETTHA